MSAEDVAGGVVLTGILLMLSVGVVGAGAWVDAQVPEVALTAVVSVGFLLLVLGAGLLVLVGP